jgi:putative PEP-CTERM system TPR-repeat lipoprotein
MSRYLTRCAVLAVLVLAGACKKDPQQAKREYFDSGNQYYAQQKYKEAVVEYRNAIQQDPKFGEARYKLAETYSKLNDIQNAYREYIRAADLLPNDNEAQLKAATFLLIAGQSEDAKSRADKVLARDPKNVQAQVVRANALAGLKDLDGAIREINEAIELDPKQASTYANLGALELARGRQEDAETAFKKAVATDPKNVNAQLALGNFYWAAARPQDAEASFKHAAELEPTNLLANRALATFYLASNRVPEAEKYLKAVADTSKDGASRMALADYYAGSNRKPEAMPILQALAGEQQYFAEAKARIAAIQYSDGKKEEAHKTIDEVLTKQPTNAKALLVKARFLVADNKIDEALVKVKAAATADPQSAIAQYMLGSIYASRNDVDEAVKAFREVLKINPRAVPAQLQLSRLELLRGGAASSVQLAEDALKSQPENPVARLMLVKSLAANGDLTRAESEINALLAKYPKSAPVHAEAGAVAMRKNNAVLARREFEAAAQLDQNSFEALNGLVALDVMSGKPADALARINSQLQRTPKAAPVYILAARVYDANHDTASIEQSLRKAIELDSSLLQAYGMLGQLYVKQQKLDQASAEFQKITLAQPKNVAAHTMIAMILQMQGKQADAQKKYEQILQIDSRAAVAANNLAWIYAESGTNLDQALQLAQTAKAALPEQPEVNDTLGFVYLKKDLATLAVPPLRVSVEKDPKNPIYHYRLGLAYFKTGDHASARRELETALKLSASFPGAEEAKQTLARLQS